MAEQTPLILKDGKVQQFNPLLDEIDGLTDFLSGTDLIPDGSNLIVKQSRQTINFTSLTIDGTLHLDGDLWLA